MIYAINRKTKEHIKDPSDEFKVPVLANIIATGVDPLWRLEEADADGWIEWSGKKECPLPEGALCEIKFKDNDVLNCAHPEQPRWAHEGSGGDIIAYRPLLEPQEQVNGDSLGSPKDHPAYNVRFSTGKIGTSDKAGRWRGPEDGLPPVGTVCETFITNEWLKVTIVGVDHDVAIFRNPIGSNPDYGFSCAKYFRPLRTDREQWVDRARYLITPAPDPQALMGAIYDALVSGDLPIPGENKHE